MTRPETQVAECYKKAPGMVGNTSMNTHMEVKLSAIQIDKWKSYTESVYVDI